jgi:hypothetical protein
MKQQLKNIKNQSERSPVSFGRLFQKIQQLSIQSPLVSRLTRSGILAFVLAAGPSALQAAQRSMLNANDYGNRLNGNQELITSQQNWVVSPKHESPVVQLSAKNTVIKAYVEKLVNHSRKWPMVIQNKSEELGFPIKSIDELKSYFAKNGVLTLTYREFNTDRIISTTEVSSYEELEKLAVMDFDKYSTPTTYSTITMARTIKYFDSQISFVSDPAFVFPFLKTNSKSNFSQNSEDTGNRYIDGRLSFGFPFIDLKKQDIYFGLDYIANLRNNVFLSQYTSATDGANTTQTTNTSASNTSQAKSDPYGANFLTELGGLIQTNFYTDPGTLFVQGSFHGKVPAQLGGPKMKDAWQRFGLQLGFAPNDNAHWGWKTLAGGSQMVTLSASYDMTRYAASLKQQGAVEINADKAIADYQMLRGFVYFQNPLAALEAYTKWLYKHAQWNIGVGFNAVTVDSELEDLKKYGFTVSSLPVNPVFGTELSAKLPEIMELFGANPYSGNMAWMFMPYKIGTGVTTSKALLQWMVQINWRIPGWNTELVASYGRTYKDADSIDRATQTNEFIRIAGSIGF